MAQTNTLVAHVNQQQGALFPAAPQEATAILNVIGYCFTEPGLELRLPDFFFFFNLFIFLILFFLLVGG